MGCINSKVKEVQFAAEASPSGDHHGVHELK
jgi:calcium-dependent protein kinase